MRSGVIVSAVGIGYFLAGAGLAHPQTSIPVEQIMQRVADNQDRARELRSAFVYNQNLLIRFFRGNGKLAREEIREFTVTPGPKDTVKTLRRFQGRYEKDGAYVEYAEPGYRYKDMDLDGELITAFADDLTSDRESRDGIEVDLFPLTTKAQAGYRFRLEGREEYRGKEVFLLSFEPADDKRDSRERIWSGLILVDANEFQPVMVTTRLARKIPMLVRTALGTNLKGLGFKITYDRFDEGLWFPVTYGGEFELKAVFFYKRKMAIALRNHDFQHARVDTRVTYGTPPGESAPPVP